jgi:hypothetical protein
VISVGSVNKYSMECVQSNRLQPLEIGREIAQNNGHQQVEATEHERRILGSTLKSETTTQVIGDLNPHGKVRGLLVVAEQRRIRS